MCEYFLKNIFLFENILCFLFKKLIFTMIKISKIHENGLVVLLQFTTFNKYYVVATCGYFGWNQTLA
jgi:hypothetical protein